MKRTRLPDGTVQMTIRISRADLKACASALIEQLNGDFGSDTPDTESEAARTAARHALDTVLAKLHRR